MSLITRKLQIKSRIKKLVHEGFKSQATAQKLHIPPENNSLFQEHYAFLMPMKRDRFRGGFSELFRGSAEIALENGGEILAGGKTEGERYFRYAR